MLRVRLAVVVVVAALVSIGCSSSTTTESASTTIGNTTSAAEPATTSPATTSPATTSTALTTNSAPTTTTFAVGDLVFDAVVAGPADGETVILLHGFPSTNHQWRSQVDALSAKGYRVIAPNQRGYSPGARPEAVEDYSIDLLVEDVVGLADAAGVERFHLVGHDWGAAVAWVVGVVHPDRLLSLTAVSVPHPAAYSAALADPEGEQTAKSGYIAVFRSPGFEEQMVADDAAFLRGIYRDAGQTDDEMQANLEVLGNVEASGAALNWYRATELSGGIDTPAVEVPTLFVYSDGDCCIGADAAENNEAFVDAEYTYVVLEGVNHWVTETAPDRLNEALIAHLERN